MDYPVELIHDFVKAAEATFKPYGVSDTTRSTRGRSPRTGTGGLMYSMPSTATHKSNPSAVEAQKIIPPPPV